MKPLLALALSTLLAVGSTAALATPKSLNEFHPGLLSVLVQVNAQGKITAASPSAELSPQLDRLLRQNLAEMISKPATDRHGHSISSQVVINVALETSPRAGGDYDANFAYVSTRPVPTGSWYWAHIDGHRLALVNRDSRRNRILFESNHRRPVYRPATVPVHHLPSPTQNASHPAPPAPQGR